MCIRDRWYTDPECTQRVDFSKLFNANTTIYGKLSPGTLGGTLPCVAGTGSAAWSLPDDGTLYLRGAGKVDNLDWSLAHRKDPSKISGHWLDYRKNITRVSMTPSLRANNVNCWFAGAESLTDVSEFSIPRGVNSTKFLFYYCYALELSLIHIFCFWVHLGVQEWMLFVDDFGHIKTVET